MGHLRHFVDMLGGRLCLRQRKSGRPRSIDVEVQTSDFLRCGNFAVIPSLSASDSRLKEV